MIKKTKTICVSGAVGTGKTTISLKISKALGFEYIDVNKIISKNKNVVCGFDSKRDTAEIDTAKLNKVLIKLIENFSGKGLVIDSHLSHYLPAKYVDACVVSECSDLKKLRARLVKRKYSKLKISENLESEILEVCLVEALENKHNVILVDTSKKIDYKKIIKEIKKYL